MSLALIVAAIALVVACVALRKARQVARRAERLAESYWELRHELVQLNAKVDRLDVGAVRSGITTDAGDTAPAGAPTTSFISLSSLKK